MRGLEDAVFTLEIDFLHSSPLYSIGSDLDERRRCAELNAP